MRSYIILNTEEIDTVDFTKVLESRDTLRYNLTGTKTFVKYVGDKPTFLEGKTSYGVKAFRILLNDRDNGWVEDL